MTIHWRTDARKARDEALERGLPLALDFFNPACPGCRKMERETWSDPALGAFLEEAFVPLRLAHDDPGETRAYAVRSTPTLVLTTAAGTEFHRITGASGPMELLDALNLGLAKADLSRGDLARACARLEDLASRSTDAAGAAGETRAEALYELGQCRFRLSGDRMELKRAAEALAAGHPDSPFTDKARPHLLL